MPIKKTISKFIHTLHFNISIIPTLHLQLTCMHTCHFIIHLNGTVLYLRLLEVNQIFITVLCHPST